MSKLALSVVIATSAILGCSSPPDRGSGNSTTGGSVSSGGVTESGGTTQTSSAGGAGGTSSSGGDTGQGGAMGGSGGTTSSSSGGAGGKTSGSGGQTSGGTTTQASGGSGGQTSGGAGGKSTGGTTTAQTGGASGGRTTDTTPSGGSATGGAPGSGGAAGGSSAGTGGKPATGGTTGSGGSTSTRTGPCDIYAAANTPCVAAHSTVRALYGSYTGNLYQVRKSGSTKDIPVGADGYVDIAVQDAFCSGGGCTISILYDQSPKKNDLVKSPKALWLPNGGDEASATLGKITINGHTAYGIYVDNSGGNTGVGYRNNATTGLAKNDEPEAMYMVVDGKRYNQWCCFDYGNAETSGKDDGNATMECLYWGNSTQWTRGGGNGPWMAADLENGMFEGDSSNAPSNTSITGWSWVVGMLKGPSGTAMVIKAGNAQSGTLETKWNGKRPAGSSPMKKHGAIILGTGGDGSNNAKGTYYEGAITNGNPPDTTDDAVQANIIAAGYGK